MADDSPDLRDATAGDGSDVTAPNPEIRFPDWLESRSAERPIAPGEAAAETAGNEPAPVETVPPVFQIPAVPIFSMDREPAPIDVARGVPVMRTPSEDREPPRIEAAPPAGEAPAAPRPPAILEARPPARGAPREPREPAPVVALPRAHAAPESGTPPASRSPSTPERNAEVEAWVARFRDPNGPPRIGCRVTASTPLADDLEDSPVPRPSAPPEPRASLERPRVPLALVPPRSEARHGAVRAMTGSSFVAWIAAGLVVVAFGFLISNATRNATPTRPVQRSASAARAPVPRVPPIIEADQPAPSVAPVDEARREPTPVAGKSAPPSRAARPPSSFVALRPAAPAPTAVAAVGAGTSGVQPPETAAAGAPYGIEVATFMFEGRAREERDKLAGIVSAGCRVAPSFEDGARVYRVLVGPLSGRARAESLATALFGRGLIGEGRVVRWTHAGGR